MNRCDDGAAVVGGVVLDDDDFEGDVLARGDAVQRLGDDVGVVVHRDDHAHLRRGVGERRRLGAHDVLSAAVVEHARRGVESLQSARSPPWRVAWR